MALQHLLRHAAARRARRVAEPGAPAAGLCIELDGLLDLLADRLDAALDRVGRTGAIDDRRVVLVDRNALGGAEHADGDVLELDAEILADRLAAGQDRDVLQHRLATITEARGLHGDGAERATDLVYDERRECFAFDIFGDDEQRLAGLHDLLEHRHDVLHGRDLRVHDQDVRILEYGFHALGVGDEVVRDVALVEAHTFGEFEFEAERVALFDGDDA